MIYADNAATTELDKDAFEAMRIFLTKEYGNASQPYSFAHRSKKALQDARQRIANCIGALSEEIFFTSCGTESNNWAIKMATEEKGDIVTSSIEHHAILNSCLTMQRKGRNVVYVPVLETGEVSVKTVKRYITDDTRLISIMYANNEIGTVQKIKELAALAHKHNAVFHTDAVQAVGHLPINVHDLDVDLLSASAHKFNGPKGTGFLYIKKDLEIQPFMDGGAQEYGKRAGTENVAGIVAMAIALEKNCKEMQENQVHLVKLEQKLLERLYAAGIEFKRNGGNCRVPGNVNLSFKGCDGEMLLHRMDLKGICISTGSACDSVNTQVSHVIKAIGIPKEFAEGTIRISFGKHNTEKEAETVADALIDIVRCKAV